MSDKLHLEAVDPPGTPGRRWQCRYCLSVGTLAELRASPCGAGASHPAPVAN